jgi:FkbM family methyltransferase
MSDNPTWLTIIESETDPRYGVQVRHIKSGNDGDISIAAITELLLINKKNPICIDIGVDEGWWSFFVLDINPTSTVTSFEPNILSYNALFPYIENEPRIKLHNIAISDKEGTIPFIKDKGQSHSRDENTTERVICKPIGSYIEGKYIDLMKIDTEGHEFYILKTLRPYLSSIESIIFEFSPYWYKDLTIVEAELQHLLTEYPKMFWLSRRGQPTLTPIKKEDISSFISESMIIHMACDILVSRI